LKQEKSTCTEWKEKDDWAEWVELMTEASRIGLTIEEVREFLRKE